MASMGLNLEEQKAVDEFRTNVVAPSMEKLVILDFWAEWCGPCKQLAPVLEKVAADYADRGVVLVKINVDENNFIASQFQVRSIPTVYAIFQGQPVADLTPARTEPQLAQMLDQLLSRLPIAAAGEAEDTSVDHLICAGEELLANDGAEQAYGIFAEALAVDEGSAAALSGMVRAAAALGRSEEAHAIFDAIPEDLRGDPAVERAGAALALLSAQRDPDEISALRDAVTAAPEDHKAKLDLAEALVAGGERDEAAELLLGSIAADRDWEDGAARKKLLELFELVGLEDPWVAATRRRLSAILFG